MQVFIDTEFTTLIDPQLISIGAVTEDGRSFYAISDDFHRHRVSRFVADVVLPLLVSDTPTCVKSPARLAAEFADWLIQVAPGGATLVADYEADLHLAQQLLHRAPTPPKANLHLMPQNIVQSQQDPLNEFFRLNPSRRRHHALDDAMALRAVCMDGSG